MQPMLALVPWSDATVAEAATRAGTLVVQPPGLIAERARWPAGYQHDVVEEVVGHGPEAFAAASERLRNWGQFPAGWAAAVADGPPRLGQRVGLRLEMFGLHWACFGEVVALTDTPTEYGFAYGTLEAHVEEGEEWFGVRLEPDGRVIYRLAAFSRPRHWMARLGAPVVRMGQRRFQRESVAMMRGRRALGWGFWLVTALWLGLAAGLRPDPHSGRWAELLLLLLAGWGAALWPGLSLAACGAWLALVAASVLGQPWLVLPWGAWMGWRAGRVLRRPRTLAVWTEAFTWGFGLMGAAWLALFLTGRTPWGFHPDIIQLTPVHLSVAGWLLAGLMVRMGRTRLALWLLAQFMLVAMLMTWRQRGGPAWPEQWAASGMAAAGFAAAWAWVRGRLYGPAILLSAGMALALGYVWKGEWMPEKLLRLFGWEGMRAAHGTLNAAAVGWAWILHRKTAHAREPVAPDR